MRSRFLFGQFLSRAPHVLSDPIRIRDGMDLVLPRRRMNFVDGRKPIGVEPPREPHQCRPQSTMDVGDFAPDQTTYQHVG